eukprot:Sspe_Gene.6299::Locus_2128_Transcript_1_1_Confidence_1.000_Length_2011::g.6299::m.6299
MLYVHRGLQLHICFSRGTPLSRVDHVYPLLLDVECPQEAGDFDFVQAVRQPSDAHHVRRDPVDIFVVRRRPPCTALLVPHLLPAAAEYLDIPPSEVRSVSLEGSAGVMFLDKLHKGLSRRPSVSTVADGDTVFLNGTPREEVRDLLGGHRVRHPAAPHHGAVRGGRVGLCKTVQHLLNGGQEDLDVPLPHELLVARRGLHCGALVRELDKSLSFRLPLDIVQKRDAVVVHRQPRKELTHVGRGSLERESPQPHAGARPPRRAVHGCVVPNRRRRSPLTLHRRLVAIRYLLGTLYRQGACHVHAAEDSSQSKAALDGRRGEEGNAVRGEHVSQCVHAGGYVRANTHRLLPDVVVLPPVRRKGDALRSALKLHRTAQGEGAVGYKDKGGTAKLLTEVGVDVGYGLGEDEGRTLDGTWVDGRRHVQQVLVGYVAGAGVDNSPGHFRDFALSAGVRLISCRRHIKRDVEVRGTH